MNIWHRRGGICTLVQAAVVEALLKTANLEETFIFSRSFWNPLRSGLLQCNTSYWVWNYLAGGNMGIWHMVMLKQKKNQLHPKAMLSDRYTIWITATVTHTHFSSQFLSPGSNVSSPLWHHSLEAFWAYTPISPNKSSRLQPLQWLCEALLVHRGGQHADNASMVMFNAYLVLHLGLAWYYSICKFALPT